MTHRSQSKDDYSGYETMARAADLQIKADGDDLRIEGYGAVYGNVDVGGDRLEPGAFADTIVDGGSVKMLWQHDPYRPIGVWDGLREDNRGLRVSGRLLSGVAQGREAIELVRAGAVDGLSIGYRAASFGFAEEDDALIRVIEKVDLWEVSLVTFPMNPKAVIDAKMAAEMSDHDIWRALVSDSRFSRRTMTALLRGGIKAVRALSKSGGADLSELTEAMRAKVDQKSKMIGGSNE